jgi:ribosomal protein S18 acetylase RimI-like enzyme
MWKLARTLTGSARNTKFMDVVCRKMSKELVPDAGALIDSFLRKDEFYSRTSSVYGDKGPIALKRALSLFLAHADLGFVWLAYTNRQPVGVCVVSYAISTSMGQLVAKLDDVYVACQFRRRGIATQMLTALAEELRRAGIGRIDTAVYTRNHGAREFYLKMDFRELGEERLSLIL